MKPITLVLPYPISANRYWRTFMPKGFKAPVTTVSPEAKAFKQEVFWIAERAGVRTPILGRVRIDYTLYPKRPLDWAKRARLDPDGWSDGVQCIDLDNAQKVLLDSLKGIVFADDKWVREIHAHRAEPDGAARVVITITPIEVQRMQPSLLESA